MFLSVRTVIFAVLTSLSIAGCVGKEAENYNNRVEHLTLAIGPFAFQHSEPIQIRGMSINHAYQYVVFENEQPVAHVFLGYLNGHANLKSEVCSKEVRSENEFRLQSGDTFSRLLSETECYGYAIVLLEKPKELQILHEDQVLVARGF